MNKESEEIRDILSRLTDVTGYDYNNRDHSTAFNIAVRRLEDLINRIDAAERI